MSRIEPSQRPGAVRPATAQPRPASDTARAIVPVSDARSAGQGASGSWDPRSPGSARPQVGFVAQLLAGADPTLRPSRMERARRAAALYADAARRVA
ncbi:hypothetical protein DK427_05745 [Methylobacterium radiodurans]|uniref:Uncharacterized protein n=1 Tax=Methylobacterium radiodurans TaxID=2202828 RepID=A0A2U8VNX5_9HYPH|nr:hypothetical protein DK427_05745 [Methylobacterium radiodurans]